MKKIMKPILFLILLLLAIILLYIAYLFIDYKRLPDQQALVIQPKTTTSERALPKETYSVTSFNIGYAAYPADYSFFMDGGKYARAYDKETVLQNLAGITTALKTLDSDIIMLQEVDVKGHRSKNVNEVKALTDTFSDYDSVFGQNYASSYLFYPVTQPIGSATSGLLSLSKSPLTKSTRISLPIETDINKFFDLDRAFTVTQTMLDDHPLTFINVHLSAFTKDTSILDNQIKKLSDYMQTAYAAGNSVIVAGDYNHDMLGNSPAVFGTDTDVRTWTHPFPVSLLPEHFSIPTGDLAKEKVPSVRSNGTPYQKGTSFVSIVDGFIVSDDIAVESVQVTNLDFQYSDHQPITLTFRIKK